MVPEAQSGRTTVLVLKNGSLPPEVADGRLDYFETSTVMSAAGGSRSLISVVLFERITTRLVHSENMPCQ